MKVYAILFQALPTNLGKIYIGTSTLNRGSFAGCAGLLAVPTVNILPSYGISLTLAPAGIDVDTLYLDADNSGEGALVTALVT